MKCFVCLFLYLTMKVRRLVPVAFTFFRSSCALLRHEPNGVLSFPSIPNWLVSAYAEEKFFWFPLFF